MLQFEYGVVKFPHGNEEPTMSFSPVEGDYRLHPDLNVDDPKMYILRALGKAGWELAGVAPDGKGTCLFFKRSA